MAWLLGPVDGIWNVSLAAWQVVPVLLGGLPLREDYDEAEAVYGALAGLLLNPATQQRVAGSLPAILQVGQRRPLSVLVSSLHVLPSPSGPPPHLALMLLPAASTPFPAYCSVCRDTADDKDPVQAQG